MQLSMARNGEAVQVKRIIGRSEVKKLLESLGFVTGTDVSVVSSVSGNIIVNIKGSRVAVDKDMAKHILV